MLGTKPRMLCLSGKHHSKWAASPAPRDHVIFGLHAAPYSQCSCVFTGHHTLRPGSWQIMFNMVECFPGTSFYSPWPWSSIIILLKFHVLWPMSKFGSATSSPPNSSILEIVYILVGRGFSQQYLLSNFKVGTVVVWRQSWCVTGKPHPVYILDLLWDFLMLSKVEKKGNQWQFRKKCQWIYLLNS